MITLQTVTVSCIVIMTACQQKIQTFQIWTYKLFQVFYDIEEIIQELSDMDMNILKTFSMVENYLNIEIF